MPSHKPRGATPSLERADQNKLHKAQPVGLRQYPPCGLQSIVTRLGSMTIHLTHLYIPIINIMISMWDDKQETLKLLTY